MCAIVKTYELYLVETGELLSDGLTFDDVPELHKAYEDFYGEGTIVACYRQHSKTLHRICTNAQAFKTAWIDFFEELQTMGNLQ